MIPNQIRSWSVIWLKNDPRSDHDLIYDHDLIFFDQIMPISGNIVARFVIDLLFVYILDTLISVNYITGN